MAVFWSLAQKISPSVEKTSLQLDWPSWCSCILSGNTLILILPTHTKKNTTPIHIQTTRDRWMGSDHHLKSLTLARTQAAEEQSLPFSTVICNIVSVNVSCGYGCNCPEKTANNCSNKMEHIRITAGCPTASMPASFTPPVIMQFHKELNYCLSSTKQSLHI